MEGQGKGMGGDSANLLHQLFYIILKKLMAKKKGQELEPWG